MASNPFAFNNLTGSFLSTFHSSRCHRLDFPRLSRCWHCTLNSLGTSNIFPHSTSPFQVQHQRISMPNDVRSNGHRAWLYLVAVGLCDKSRPSHFATMCALDDRSSTIQVRSLQSAPDVRGDFMLLLEAGCRVRCQIGHESVIYGVCMLALCLAPEFVVVRADVLLSSVLAGGYYPASLCAIPAAHGLSRCSLASGS